MNVRTRLSRLERLESVDACSGSVTGEMRERLQTLREGRRRQAAAEGRLEEYEAEEEARSAFTRNDPEVLAARRRGDWAGVVIALLQSGRRWAREGRQR
jgi:hypothetical protein